MKRIFKGIWGAVKCVFSSQGRMAYLLAEAAARMTPTRTDDEIFALARKWGVPAAFDAQDKGAAIGYIVFQALKQQYPGTADRVLNRAIEIAYGAVKP